MSAPHKPWENQSLNNGQYSNIGSLNPEMRNALYSHGPQPPSQTVPSTVPLTRSQRPCHSLPPLPQRPPQLYNQGGMMAGLPRYGGYGAMGMGYDPYRTGYPGGYGGYGYGSFPVGGGFENRFLQVARDGSRDAFESIESIVRAFSSVSMMLESTYYAMNSSFNAVLGVVDNFSRLRQMFIQFVSTMTILRIIRNFYRRLLYWLGVLDRSTQADSVWDSVSGPAGAEVSSPAATGPKWPLITFLAFLFGGPYLISKLFPHNQSGSQWDRARGRPVVAAYPHKAGTERELSFQAGEALNIAPKEMQQFENSGWLMAMNERNQVGYVPITRLVIGKPVAGPVAEQVHPAPAPASGPQ